MNNQIIKSTSELGMPLAEAAKKVQVGREMLTAVRAELRAVEKIGAANELRLEKLKKAQTLAEQVLDAETALGALIANMPEGQGARTDLELADSTVRKLTKQEAVESIGLTVKQANRFEQLAANPDLVDRMKAEARKNGEIISRTAILKAISDNRKPYIVNNSGNGDWYTPSCYTESARTVMGSITLDPASCAAANETVKADAYYSIEEDGLSQPWYGNVWLNPPYNLISKFVSKLLESNDVQQAIILVNNASETQWFQTLMGKASAMVFHLGRLRFQRPTGERSAPMQGQVFFYIGNDSGNFLSEFRKYGFGLSISNCSQV